MIIDSINEIDGSSDIDNDSTLSAIDDMIASNSGVAIKVIGVGGAGGNAVDCMIDQGVQNVQFIAINTDAQALKKSKAPQKKVLGAKITGGLGTGGKPETGEETARDDYQALEELVRGAEMVFITAGMGGGTGTGAAPVVAELTKKMNILTVAVVTTPFAFEGRHRANVADDGLVKLRQQVDTLIVIQNEMLLDKTFKERKASDMFGFANSVLSQGVIGISEIITKTGYINTDFADVKVTMSGKGDAIMGIGVGNGDQRIIDAATKAIDNPLLGDVKIDSARNVLINVTTDSDFVIDEFNELVTIITANCHPEANIIWGWINDAVIDDELKVTVIATGFNPPNIEDEPPQLDSQQTADSAKEYISIDEYINITQGDDTLFETTSFETEHNQAVSIPDSSMLRVPTVLRQRKR